MLIEDLPAPGGARHLSITRGVDSVNDQTSNLGANSLLSRRRALSMGASVVALCALGSWGFSQSAMAQRKKASPSEVPLDELMKPGPLPELVLGNADAPIT